MEKVPLTPARKLRAEMMDSMESHPDERVSHFSSGPEVEKALVHRAAEVVSSLYRFPLVLHFAHEQNAVPSDPATTFRVNVERFKAELLQQVQPGSGLVNMRLSIQGSKEEERAAAEALAAIAVMLHRPIILSLGEEPRPARGEEETHA